MMRGSIMMYNVVYVFGSFWPFYQTHWLHLVGLIPRQFRGLGGRNLGSQRAARLLCLPLQS